MTVILVCVSEFQYAISPTYRAMRLRDEGAQMNPCRLSIPEDCEGAGVRRFGNHGWSGERYEF